MASERETVLFSRVPPSTLAERLVRAMGSSAGELADNPRSYLQTAFSLDNSNNWIAVRLLRDLGDAAVEVARHPFRFINGARLSDQITVLALNESTLSSSTFVDGRFIASAVTPEAIVTTRRRRLRPVLAVSAFFHSFLIVYLLYIAIVSPYAHLRIVNKAYRPFDPTMLGPLVYPPGMIKAQNLNKTLSLEEIQERARKRQEQLAKQREKEERERLAREKAEQEKAEREKQIAEAKAAEEKKASEAKPDGKIEFNEAALKDIVGKLSTLYHAGGLDVENTRFTVMLSFKIKPDGSLTGFNVLKSSGSKSVDEKAADVLWTIGESHALGTLSTLTSNSIRLDVTEQNVRVTITSFAPSAEIAKQKASDLNALFFFLKLAQKAKGNNNVVELLSMAKVRSDNNRIDADLTMTRAMASQLLSNKVGTNPTNPQ
jgi:hypothetical protein